MIWRAPLSYGCTRKVGRAWKEFRSCSRLLPRYWVETYHIGLADIKIWRQCRTGFSLAWFTLRWDQQYHRMIMFNKCWNIVKRLLANKAQVSCLFSYMTSKLGMASQFSLECDRQSSANIVILVARWNILFLPVFIAGDVLPEDVPELFMNLSPFEMKTLLYHILSGKEFNVSRG